jgi:hypothetical protein
MTAGQTPDVAARGGYLFAYFTGEDTTDGEQVRLALSEGADPLHWRPLHGGDPVVVSTQGTEGLRDPFLVRGPDRFFLLATDLRIHGSGDWDACQRHGSRAIMVWESSDLVRWGPQRSLVVAPPDAGDAWAPKGYYDPTCGEYRILFSCALFPDGDRSAPIRHRTLAVRTRDLRTASEPETYLDRDVIDVVLLTVGDQVHRFLAEDGSITQEVSTAPDGAFREVRRGIGRPEVARGEGPAVFGALEGGRWFLFIDEFGGRGYVPFETSDPRSGAWTPSSSFQLPPGARHGSVLVLTAEEHARLSHEQITVRTGLSSES